MKRTTFAITEKCAFELRIIKIETGYSYGKILEKAISAYGNSIKEEALLSNIRMQLPDIDKAIKALTMIKAQLER